MRAVSFLIVLSLGMLARDAYGQDKPAPASHSPAPAAATITITLEEQAEWLQSRAELAEAKVAVQAATERLAKIAKTITDRCPIVMDEKQRPMCAPPPTPPAKPETGNK